MILVKDTEAAARHAIDKGLISGYEMEPILDEMKKDGEKKEILFAHMKK